MRARVILSLLVAALAAGFAVPASADAAREPYVAIQGAVGPGPAKYNRVFVHRFGSSRASRVLLLVPGYLGGAGDFTQIARQLTARVPNLQVWALDRRENALEDTSVFRTGTPQQAYDYYFGLKARYIDGNRDTPFARGWGLKLALEDLRKVVLEARAGGRREVILGGHSLGASTAAAYASWDFNGHPGYRDIKAMVLIDGGLLGTFSTPNLATVKRRLAALRTGDPFVTLFDGLPPWAAGVFSELAGMYAKRLPGAASTLQASPLVPANLKPSVRVTNQAALGFALDFRTSLKALALIQVNSGRLSPSGDPRPWQNTGLTPIQNVASGFFQEPGNFVEWYFPARLTLDVDGADGLSRNPITNYLGLRTWHRGQINVPLYAEQTTLTHGRVLRGARRLFRSSRIPRVTYVDAPNSYHLDPLLAAPSKNVFLKTVVPFLKSL
jgi:pimeloyl-ACP methyl ester carboxylesterase